MIVKEKLNQNECARENVVMTPIKKNMLESSL